MSSATIHIPLSPLDHVPPVIYVTSVFYLPLKPGVNQAQVFEVLQEGLRRTFATLPWVCGKVWPQDPKTPGWRPGQLEIRYNPEDINSPEPYQLKFNQLDSPFSYDELKDESFPSNTFEYEELMWAPFAPPIDTGSEVFVSQANFIPGGCILTQAIHHAAGDGTASATIVKLWSENCVAMQSKSPTLFELAPGSSDRTLIEQIWTKEGTGTSLEKIEPEVWAMLGLEKPDSTPTALSSGYREIPDAKAKPVAPNMKSATFYISPSVFTALQEECARELGSKTRVSGNDILCAVIWRFFIKARSTIVSETGTTAVGEEATAVLSTIHDGRTDFSQSLPPTYLGNLALESHSSIPVVSITSPNLSIASIASTVRNSAGVIKTANFMNAHTIARSMPSFTDMIQWKLKRQGRVGEFTLLLTSLLLFQTDSMNFGAQCFGNGGSPDGFSLLMGGLKNWTRICFVLPRKKNGGVEFVLNLSDQEMDFLLEDDEFAKYASFVS